MKLSVQAFPHFANTPKFTVDFGHQEFDPPTIIPMGGSSTQAWFISFNYDLSVMDYRLLCEKRQQGNVNYGYSEAGYKSGWASRVSVINKQLGYAYVDVSGRGVELDKFIYLVADKYVGDVYLCRTENDTDLEYHVAPYIKDKVESYPAGNSLILHTAEPDFVTRALNFLVGTESKYVGPSHVNHANTYFSKHYKTNR
jgi:hypothetical protein